MKRKLHFTMAWLWLALLPVLAQSAVVQSVQVVAENATLASQLPAVQTISIATAGQYTLRLTDLSKQSGSGGAFSYLGIALYQGSQLIKSLAVPSSAASATATFALSTGSYQVQVLGITSSASQYGASLSDAAGTVAWSKSDAISTPAAQDNSVVQQSLSVIAGHTYAVVLTDRAFPQAFAQLASTVTDGSTSLNCTLFAAGSCNFTATSNTALLSIYASPGSSGKGLYSIRVTDTASGDVYAASIPVGAIPSARAITLPNNATYVLTTRDGNFPQALSTYKSMLVQGANAALVNGSGTASLSARAGSASLYVIAEAAGGSAGYYSTAVSDGNTVVYQSVDSVDGSASTTTRGYVLKLGALGTASYTVKMTDFVVPERLTTLLWTVSQGTQVLVAQRSGSGTVTFNATAGAGDVSVEVLTIAGASGAGLFGVTLTDAGGNVTFNQTQGVGASFVTQAVTASAGQYQLVASDFLLPAANKTLVVALTQGATLIGSAVASGGTATLPLNVSAGQYALNVIALPQTGQGYGMYGLTLAGTPTVTLSAVASGSNVTLTWSSTDADGCTASGAWSGSRAISGTLTLTQSNGSQSYTLSCTGIAGSASQTASVTVSAAESASKGGGGLLDWPMLCLLSLLCGLRARRTR